MLRSMFLFFIVCFSSGVYATSIIPEILEDAEMVGSGEYKAMFWKIYDAELHASGGEFAKGNPFALRLVYSRDIPGDAIADKSIELIRRQGISDEFILAAWHKQLNEIFPDVKKGTEIIGTHTEGEGATFYVDGKKVGAINDLRLCGSFFGIWLAEDTVSPKLRSQLLGLASN